MRYDITLKFLLHQMPLALLQMLTGQAVVETLTVEYPTVQRRLPDLVLRLADGHILHLELQSGPDPDLPWRMLEYYWLIYLHYRVPVIQMVLYVGPDPNPLADHLHQDRLDFHYTVLDSRELDAGPLLQSPVLADNLLALLCRLDDPLRALRQVLGKIVTLPDNARNAALESLVILSGLRSMTPIVKREIGQMPITVNLMENEFFRDALLEAEAKARREGEERGRREGEERGRRVGEYLILSKQLENRFGALPAEVTDRLQSASPDALERWSLALLRAGTLEEVFKE